MAEKPSSKSGSWKVDLPLPARERGHATGPADIEESGVIDVSQTDIQEVRASVRRNTGEMAAVKTVHVTDAFTFLHPDVQRDVASLCDLKDEPFLFDQQLREYCAENKLFLPGISSWLLGREVRAKIRSTDEPDDGWRFEDNLEEAESGNPAGNLGFVTLTKVSGSFLKHMKDSSEKVSLRNILPYNLLKNE